MLWLLLFYPEVVDVVDVAVLSRSSGCCGCCCCNTRDVANTPLLVLWDGNDVLTLAASLLTRQDCRLTVLEQRLCLIGIEHRTENAEQSLWAGLVLQGTPNRRLELGHKRSMIQGTSNSHLLQVLPYRDHDTEKIWQHLEHGFSYRKHDTGNTGILIQGSWIREHRTITWIRDYHTRNMDQGTSNIHLEQEFSYSLHDAWKTE